MEINGGLMQGDVGRLVRKLAANEFGPIDPKIQAVELGQLAYRNPNKLGSKIVNDD